MFPVQREVPRNLRSEAPNRDREAQNLEVGLAMDLSQNTDLDKGILIGVLIGEGHFGGDGRQPQVTLRMHTRHQALFEWIVEHFGGKLYGPYHHGGRDYYQWMARGAHLREHLMPLLNAHLRVDLDGQTFRRFSEMKERYEIE